LFKSLAAFHLLCCVSLDQWLACSSVGDVLSSTVPLIANLNIRMPVI